MIVVADTAPLNYLILIEQVDLLRVLYGEVFIPEAVWHELSAPAAPASVAQWVSGIRTGCK